MEDSSITAGVSRYIGDIVTQPSLGGTDNEQVSGVADWRVDCMSTHSGLPYAKYNSFINCTFKTYTLL